jgi:hypothetical protein
VDPLQRQADGRLRRLIGHSIRLSPAPPKPDLLGELRTNGGICRSDHRILGRQVPPSSVLLRRHAVARAEIALEHFQWFAVFQAEQIELIASENIVSRAVLEAQGSVLTNKYAEGYPGRRYYGGCEYVDEVETLAIERAKALFGCAFANVQPHSGSQANQAVFMALMKPGDTFMGMDLAAGGHLTHGKSVNQSGKWFKPVPYTACAPRTRSSTTTALAEIARRQAQADHRRRLGL